MPCYYNLSQDTGACFPPIAKKILKKHGMAYSWILLRYKTSSMKTILILLVIAALTGCYSSRRDLQVEIVSAELIRIDTIHRYSPAEYRQQLTWRDEQNMEYVSFAPMEAVYAVGTRMPVLKTR
jgi:hypothetical protein